MSASIEKMGKVLAQLHGGMEYLERNGLDHAVDVLIGEIGNLKAKIMRHEGPTSSVEALIVAAVLMENLCPDGTKSYYETKLNGATKLLRSLERAAGVSLADLGLGLYAEPATSQVNLDARNDLVSLCQRDWRAAGFEMAEGEPGPVPEARH
jgi:hypothetical protein